MCKIFFRIPRSSEGSKTLYFHIGFANKEFHKKTVLLIFYAEYMESVLNMLSYLEYGHIIIGAREQFSKVRFSDGWKELFYD